MSIDGEILELSYRKCQSELLENDIIRLGHNEKITFINEAAFISYLDHRNMKYLFPIIKLEVENKVIYLNRMNGEIEEMKID